MHFIALGPPASVGMNALHGFHPCKSESDIWMQHNGDIYEYIGVYVDDIYAAAKDSKAITNLLHGKYQ